MIDEQLEEIERALKGASLVIFSDFQRIYTSPNSAYVKGEARFMNNSFLNLFHHVCSMVGVGFRLRPTQLTDFSISFPCSQGNENRDALASDDTFHHRAVEREKYRYLSRQINQCYHGDHRYIKDGVPDLTNVFKSMLRRLIVLKPELLSCE